MPSRRNLVFWDLHDGGGATRKGILAEAGGFVEIARLYLTRDAAENPENDEIHGQQLVFWDLMAMILQPSQGLFEVADLLQGLGILGQINANNLEQTISDTAAFTYWTT